MKINKKKLVGLITISLTVGFSLLLVYIPSETLLSHIGTDNVYIFMYLIALVGSISTFASIPYPLFLISFAAAGFDPALLGLTSAAGAITTDSITFFAARQGRVLLSERLQQSITATAKLINRHPKWQIPSLVLYGTISPFSNDFAVISLSLMNFRYHRVVMPLAIGNVIYNITIAYLGIYAYNWVAGLF